MVGGGGEGKISKLARVVLGNRSGKVQVLQEWHKKMAKSPQFFFFLILLSEHQIRWKEISSKLSAFLDFILWTVLR